MDFHLSKEHLLVRKMYREFAENEVKPLAEELDEEEKKACCVVGRSVYNAQAYGGVVYSFATNASSPSPTVFGSRLAFKTRELAEYCEKQFIDIWDDYLFG